MPVTPINVSASLKDILGANAAFGKLAVQLCGFGSQIPRVGGTAILADVAPIGVKADGAGAVAFTIWGNDVITPADTFYTVQAINNKGNIVQANAYQFTGAGAVDLNSVAPFTPYVPPPVPPQQPGAIYAVIAYSANPVFNCAGAGALITFDITLTGNVIGPTVTNISPGQVVTFLIQQDGAGAHTFAWPGNCITPPVINPAANGITIQSFVARNNGNLYPIAPAMVV